MSKLEELTEDFGVTLKHMAEQSYKPMTNGDRIRAMTDEELAEFNSFCQHIDEECTMKGCIACVLEWLKQPCEVEK